MTTHKEERAKIARLKAIIRVLKNANKELRAEADAAGSRLMVIRCKLLALERDNAKFSAETSDRIKATLAIARGQR